MPPPHDSRVRSVSPIAPATAVAAAGGGFGGAPDRTVGGRDGGKLISCSHPGLFDIRTAASLRRESRKSNAFFSERGGVRSEAARRYEV